MRRFSIAAAAAALLFVGACASADDDPPGLVTAPSPPPPIEDDGSPRPPANLSECAFSKAGVDALNAGLENVRLFAMDEDSLFTLALKNPFTLAAIDKRTGSVHRLADFPRRPMAVVSPTSGAMLFVSLEQTGARVDESVDDGVGGTYVVAKSGVGAAVRILPFSYVQLIDGDTLYGMDIRDAASSISGENTQNLFTRVFRASAVDLAARTTLISPEDEAAAAIVKGELGSGAPFLARNGALYLRTGRLGEPQILWAAVAGQLNTPTAPITKNQVDFAAVTNEAIYFLERHNGMGTNQHVLRRRSHTGEGPVATLFNQGVDNAVIAADKWHVYFTEREFLSGDKRLIRVSRVLVAGGVPSTVAERRGPNPENLGVAGMDDTCIYIRAPQKVIAFTK